MACKADDMIDYGEGKISRSDLRDLLATLSTKYHCGTYLYYLEPIERYRLYQDLETERLNDKYSNLHSLFELLGRDWNQLFVAQLLHYLGNMSNRQNYIELILRLSSNAIQRARTNLRDIEVLFLAASGLEVALPDDAFTRKIRKEVQYARHKFSITPLLPSQWTHYGKSSSVNPIMRLMQVAGLLHHNDMIFDKLMSCRTRDDIFNLFNAGASIEWVRYFGGRGKSISVEKCDLLGINFVIPMLYAVGLYTSNEELTNAADNLNETLPVEDNTFIRGWRGVGLCPTIAYEGQALIQLKKVYCDNKQCEQCVVYRHMCGRASILSKIPRFLY